MRHQRSKCDLVSFATRKLKIRSDCINPVSVLVLEQALTSHSQVHRTADPIDVRSADKRGLAYPRNLRLRREQPKTDVETRRFSTFYVTILLLLLHQKVVCQNKLKEFWRWQFIKSKPFPLIFRELLSAMKASGFTIAILTSAILAACGGGDGGNSVPPTNRAPTASAGPNQNVVAGANVTLNGSKSSDPDSDKLTYRWELTTKPPGSTAALDVATSPNPSFHTDAAGSYVATLTVNDGVVDSAGATVTVTATVSNAAPVAVAGSGQNVGAGSVVTLDGSASSDANGDSLTYRWTLTSRPSGSTATLSTPEAVRPSFTADIAGDYVATLVVNDGQVDSAGASVTVMAALGPVAPVANAGTAQNVAVGSVVKLDGSTSSDANGDPLTYQWTLTGRPAGSTASLSSTTEVSPSFVADVAGGYVATLMVKDGSLSSEASTIAVTATVANAVPMANAGSAQNVEAGALVTLDGSASSDANSDPLTYRWELTARPSGSAAALANASTSAPTFAADVAGDYVATLVVNDGKADSTAATVAITASSLSLISTGFIGGESNAGLPYAGSSTSSISCLGCTAIDVQEFKLRSSGRAYTITGLKATNLTTGSSVIPSFSGLSNGQVIAAGATVPFKLQSTFTQNRTVALQYNFNIQETGQTFSYRVNLTSN